MSAAASLVDWCLDFGVPEGFMSEGSTHFKNDTLYMLSELLRLKKHFTLPYKPWSNSAVERLRKELLRVFQAVTPELQLRLEEWPDLLPLVQSAHSQPPSPHC